MIVDVHVAFLFAALSVLFGLTYTMSAFLTVLTERAKEKRELRASAELSNDVATAIKA